ncbi:MAG: hypothetical protein ACRDXF_12940 [Acidimicrobiia bacterium]
MTYLQIDHVNAVMADRMREAEHARFVREAKLANKGSREPKPRRRRRFLGIRDPLKA